jgi:hypothetical protein
MGSVSALKGRLASVIGAGSGTDGSAIEVADLALMAFALSSSFAHRGADFG